MINTKDKQLPTPGTDKAKRIRWHKMMICHSEFYDQPTYKVSARALLKAMESLGIVTNIQVAKIKQVL